MKNEMQIKKNMEGRKVLSKDDRSKIREIKNKEEKVLNNLKENKDEMLHELKLRQELRRLKEADMQKIKER